MAAASEVHCRRILVAQRAAKKHWKAGFYDGDVRYVLRRDRLFAVVDLAAA